MTALQLRILKEIALDHYDSLFSKNFLINVNSHSTSSIVKALEALMKKELLYQKNKLGKKEYRFSDPFFKRWLIKTLA